jgi:hypothetical protein
MRIAWHQKENALHFLLMDQPVQSKREASPGIVELVDADGKLVRVDALELRGSLSARYHAEEDWLEIRLREGEFQRQVHVLPKMAFSVGADDEPLGLQLRDARTGWRVPLEDIASLVAQGAESAGLAEASLELPEGLEPGEHERVAGALEALGWELSGPSDAAQGGAGPRSPRSVKLVRRPPQ